MYLVESFTDCEGTNYIESTYFQAGYEEAAIPVGQMKIQFYENFGGKVQSKRLFEVKWIEVVEGFRKEGIAKLMYKELCRKAKQCKIDTIRGDVYSKAAYKARKSAFGKSKAIFKKGVPISEKEVLKYLPNIYVQGEGDFYKKPVAVVYSNVKGCKIK